MIELLASFDPVVLRDSGLTPLHLALSAGDLTPDAIAEAKAVNADYLNHLSARESSDMAQVGDDETQPYLLRVDIHSKPNDSLHEICFPPTIPPILFRPLNMSTHDQHFQLSALNLDSIGDDCQD